jgi:hypothetical protein
MEPLEFGDLPEEALLLIDSPPIIYTHLTLPSATRQAPTSPPKGRRGAIVVDHVATPHARTRILFAWTALCFRGNDEGVRFRHCREGKR